jgi:hypothetical protein
MLAVLAVLVVAAAVAAWWRWRLDWRIPREQYAAYIASAAWARRKRRWKRETVLPWRRWCRVCWSRDVQMHHATYRRLGHELHRDLIPLCRIHHEVVTAMHHQPGVSVERATRAYLRRPRVRLLGVAPVLPVLVGLLLLR